MLSRYFGGIISSWNKDFSCEKFHLTLHIHFEDRIFQLLQNPWTLGIAVEIIHDVSNEIHLRAMPEHCNVVEFTEGSWFPS